VFPLRFAQFSVLLVGMMLRTLYRDVHPQQRYIHPIGHYRGGHMPSFVKDIRPMFREVDIDHMKHHQLDLSSYDEVSLRAHDILSQVSNGTMPPPPDTPWSQDQVHLFKDWIDQGMQP
jgi:hypothetical protein